MTDKQEMSKELEELAIRFFEGWHEGIKIDASDIMLLSNAADTLAQPEQPEVRTGNCLRVGVCASEGHKIQPQRTWVGLTDEEKAQFVVAYYPSHWDRKTAVVLMSDYEKYLKEKNNV